jgi:hypothetical protein
MPQVRLVVHYEGGKANEILALANKAKPIHAKYKGEFRIGRTYAGPDPGSYVVTVAYPDFEAFGRAMMGLHEDPEYHSLLAEVEKITKLEGRRIIMDLGV